MAVVCQVTGHTHATSPVLLTLTVSAATILLPLDSPPAPCPIPQLFNILAFPDFYQWVKGVGKTYESCGSDDLSERDFHTSPLYVYTLTLKQAHKAQLLTTPHSAQTRSELITVKEIWNRGAQIQELPAPRALNPGSEPSGERAGKKPGCLWPGEELCWGQ